MKLMGQYLQRYYWEYMGGVRFLAGEQSGLLTARRRGFLKYSVFFFFFAEGCGIMGKA